MTQYQQVFLEYTDGLWNTKRLIWNTKKFSCNAKKPLWTTQELLWNTKKLIEYHEARSNSKKLHGIPRSCPEIPRSSLEYQEGDFDEVNRQTDRHPHTYTHQEAFMNTKTLFSNTMLLRNAKKLSCNTKRLLWITKTVYGIERGSSGISRSFYVIRRPLLRSF